METWQAVLVSAGISAIAVFTVYLLSRRDRKLDRKVFDAEWTGTVNSDMGWLKETVKEIKTNIATLQDSIYKIWDRMPSSTVHESSPLRLSEVGRSISETLDGRKWAEKTAGQLVDSLREKSAYEIQSYCFDFVEDVELEHSMRRAILGCAYENGVTEDEVLEVLAIELRDRVLSLTERSPDALPDKR